MLPNAANCQGYGFYCFRVIKKDQQGKRGGEGGGVKITPTIRVNV